jgi:hypothetical protein
LRTARCIVVDKIERAAAKFLGHIKTFTNGTKKITYTQGIKTRGLHAGGRRKIPGVEEYFELSTPLWNE